MYFNSQMKDYSGKIDILSKKRLVIIKMHIIFHIDWTMFSLPHSPALYPLVIPIPLTLHVSGRNNSFSTVLWKKMNHYRFPVFAPLNVLGCQTNFNAVQR